MYHEELVTALSFHGVMLLLLPLRAKLSAIIVRDLEYEGGNRRSVDDLSEASFISAGWCVCIALRVQQTGPSFARRPTKLFDVFRLYLE